MRQSCDCFVFSLRGLRGDGGLGILSPASSDLSCCGIARPKTMFSLNFDPRFFKMLFIQKVLASKFYTSEDVIQHLEDTSPERELDNQILDIETYGKWELKKIPINKLYFDLSNVSSPDSKAILKKYNDLKTEAPPIIIIPSEIYKGRYRIVDGYHRVGIAKKRGEAEILSYLPS